jgi:hypothetical protein
MDPLKDDNLPSYAESTGGPAPPLHQQIQSTRLTHISSVVHSNIMPILNDRAARGLSHTTIALLPMASSDESAFPPTSPGFTGDIHSRGVKSKSPKGKKRTQN